MNKYISALFTVFFLQLGVQSNIHAQELSTAIAPQQYEIIAKPGSAITLPYTVTNMGDPTIYTVHVYRVVPDSNTSNFSLMEIDQTSDIQVSTSSSSFRIGSPLLLTSNEAVEFDIVLSIPETEYLSEYKIAVVAESDPPEGFEDRNRILLQGGTGSLIVVAVTENGEREEEGEIRLFSALTDFSFSLFGIEYLLQNSLSDIPLIIRVGNTGAHSFSTTGNIIIKPQWGEGSSVAIPAQRVFSQSERQLSTVDSSSYTALLHGVFINILDIEAYISMGSQSQPPQRARVIIFPFTLILISSGVVTVLFATYLLLKYVKK